MERRTFLKETALGGAVLLTGGSLMARPSLLESTGRAASLFVGTPVLPEILYERGLAATLDAMQELAEIRTVMTFCHDFQFRQYRQGFGHKTDRQGRPLTNIWIRTDPGLYEDPRWARRDPALKYADRDVLDDLWEEAGKRKMQVYARILEPYVITGAIPGFEAFAETDADGRPGNHVCFNHPGYKGYWVSVVTDLVQNHPYLHGFKFGQERGGPLLSSVGGKTGTCFCEYCLEIAREREIHVERAKAGMRELKKLGDRMRSGRDDPVDGWYVTLLRLLGEYPDVLAWEKLWMDSREGQKKRIYSTIKSIHPGAQVGWHIDHGMTWDLVTRAFWDYSAMGSYSDWLSVAVYFDSMGRRSLNHYNAFYRELIFGDADPELSYPMYLSLLGYPPENQPPLSAHEEGDTSFSAEYVYQECDRAVKAVNGAARVDARPGFNMPGYDCGVTPEMVYDAVQAALRAGVDGLWCGREWDEITPEQARAFGDAVRDHRRSGKT